MTEIAVRNGADLAAWTEAAQSVYTVAKVLSETPFAPKDMRGDPASVMGAIMLGADHNMNPMAALRNIHVIEGQPTMSALAQRGLVQAQGHLVELVEASDTRVVMRGRRKGSERWQEVTWTIDRAKKANLAGKKNWQAHPQAMLVARASSELCRLIAADVLLGCPYSSEELSDGDTAAPGLPVPEPEPVKAKPAATRTAQRAPIPDPIPETPIFHDPQPDRPAAITPARAREIAATPAPPADPEGKVTDTTRKAIMASFNDMGIRDRDTRLKRVGDIVGREIPSVNVLTEVEAKQVVAALKNDNIRPVDVGVPGEKPSDYDWPELRAVPQT